MNRHKVAQRAAVLLSALLLASAGCALPGSGGGKTGTGRESGENPSLVIMTWNVQALFDGSETGGEYEEYRAAAGWSDEKYAGRLNGIAGAVGALERAPDIIAVQEIESARVLNDLAAALAKYGYRWSHFARGAGMSLGLGIVSRFPLDAVKVHSVNVNGAAAPRPVLEARVSAGGEEIVLLVCHWKSKRSGTESGALRRASARIVLRRIRELAEAEPELPVIVLGDLNENYDEFYRRGGAAISALLPDDPRSAELAGAGELRQDFLIISKDKPPRQRYFPPEAVALYSPWFGELENGSYYYKNQWETIDHFLLSGALFNGAGWEFESSAAADRPPFTNNSGYPAAYNPRTGSGLSDHLPLLLFLKYRIP